MQLVRFVQSWFQGIIVLLLPNVDSLLESFCITSVSALRSSVDCRQARHNFGCLTVVVSVLLPKLSCIRLWIDSRRPCILFR